MPRILITPIELVRQHGPCQEILEAAGLEIVYPPVGVSLYDVDRLLAHLPGIDGVVAGMEPFNQRVLFGSRLRAIARMGVGYDAIDIPAATEQRVAVTITPGTNHDSVAEHTLALLLGVMRGFPGRDRDVRAGKWQRVPMRRLAGQTMGLIGLGRIGQAVVPRARALGLNLLAYDPQVDPGVAARLQVRLCSLDELLGAADIVSLHAPVMAETTRLIQRDTLALMRPGAVLINTARGALVDEDALADALAAGHLAGAGLDAFVVEPLPPSSRLLSLDNVLVSPHCAGVDQESIRDMGVLAAQCIVALHEGRVPSGCLVNRALAKDWRW